MAEASARPTALAEEHEYRDITTRGYGITSNGLKAKKPTGSFRTVTWVPNRETTTGTGMTPSEY
jgi:hypothetical protein